MKTRTGAAVLLQVAAAKGVQLCIANPGTTELGIVQALDDVPGVRPVLGLFEGVCTGAADGYARVTGNPALTLLHLGPGFANGIANIHNARRARSPMVNIIGDHASWHLAADSPLTSDIDALAGAVSDKVIRLAHDTVIEQVIEAIEFAKGPPGRIVSLIAPTDVMDALVPELDRQLASALTNKSVDIDLRKVEDCALRLRDASSPVLLLGGQALRERGLRAAARIADACGARLIMESYPACVELGGDLPRLERLAYFPQDVLAQLGSSKILLADAKTPVSYFGYAGQPSVLVEPERLIPFVFAQGCVVAALELLAGCLQPKRHDRITRPEPAAATPSDHLTPIDVAEVLCALLPQDAVVSLEGSTCGAPFLERAHTAARHSVMTNTGGAIGQGLPCAVGAALGRPNAQVVCLQSDGSAQYTLQSLWTMAREKLNVIVLISANHRYGILQTELKRSAADITRPAAAHLTRLDAPRIDWTALASGYGLRAQRVATRAAFEAQLTQALAVKGPCLIEMLLP